MSSVFMFGYWYEKGGDTTLPKPQAREKKWKGRKDFLAALRNLEKRADSRFYKGFSKCRVCGCQNGSSDFTITVGKKTTATWPKGFRHYVKEHNVKPDQEVIDFVMKHGG